MRRPTRCHAFLWVVASWCLWCSGCCVCFVGPGCAVGGGPPARPGDLLVAPRVALPSISHVIPLQLIQTLKSPRWNCNVFGRSQKMTVGNYVRNLSGPGPPAPTGTAARSSGPSGALHPSGAWCAVVSASSIPASCSVQNSPYSVFCRPKRYKTLPACLKCAKLGHFGRAGRVLYRKCGEGGCAGRVLYRSGAAWVALPTRISSGPRASCQVHAHLIG